MKYLMLVLIKKRSIDLYHYFIGLKFRDGLWEDIVLPSREHSQWWNTMENEYMRKKMVTSLLKRKDVHQRMEVAEIFSARPESVISHPPLR